MPGIALVTGGNRGLGLATVTALALSGHSVIMAGRSSTSLAKAAADLGERGWSVDTVSLDVDSLESLERAAQEVSRRYDRLDILVNNAGILPEATAATDHEFADPRVSPPHSRPTCSAPLP